MNSKSNKIDLLLRELKVSRTEFAETIGVTINAIANWRKRDLGINVINKIVKAYPQVSHEWLMTGNGSIISTKYNVQMQETELTRNTDKDSDFMIKLYAERIRLVDDIRISLKEELEEIRLIKQELQQQREHNKHLQEMLHDAVFALRSAAQRSDFEPLIAADK